MVCKMCDWTLSQISKERQHLFVPKEPSMNRHSLCIFFALTIDLGVVSTFLYQLGFWVVMPDTNYQWIWFKSVISHDFMLWKPYFLSSAIALIILSVWLTDGRHLESYQGYAFQSNTKHRWNTWVKFHVCQQHFHELEFQIRPEYASKAALVKCFILVLV